MFFFVQIKLEEKHPMLVAYDNISGEQYVLDTLKKTKSRYDNNFVSVYLKYTLKPRYGAHGHHNLVWSITQELAVGF